MCGIVGIVARNATVAPNLLERVTQLLVHRGPDDFGTIIVRDTLPEPVEVGLSIDYVRRLLPPLTNFPL
jgi:asparagine synthetase B (glutamine-hydrolysing)